jgi:ankyrin repeat protein
MQHICGYTHTPLQVAAANEQVDAIKLLLANGAEPSVKTRGWNALHFASQNSKNFNSDILYFKRF